MSFACYGFFTFSVTAFSNYLSRTHSLISTSTESFFQFFHSFDAPPHSSSISSSSSPSSSMPSSRSSLIFPPCMDHEGHTERLNRVQNTSWLTSDQASSGFALSPLDPLAYTWWPVSGGDCIASCSLITPRLSLIWQLLVIHRTFPQNVLQPYDSLEVHDLLGCGFLSPAKAERSLFQ